MSDQNTEHNIEGLLRKNAELLADIKTLKGRIATLEGERDAANTARDDATANVQRVMLDEPLENTVASMFSVPWRVMRSVVEEHFKLSLDESGKPMLSDVDGNPVSLGDRPANFTPDDLRQAMMAVPDLAATMRPPSGGGAPGSNGASATATPPQKAEKVAPRLGLR
ncbi:hypothetical protein [Sulfitobacter guttiformis]|uniref:Uncharacterized protein n=1 Tax=Sulfitobacter guttiformis TaxID=74349 RepID=A0A420DMS4_9RHOB|nr:hypothetical protein [Sulfitobacter guttiformis]KIN72787.1 hypothetical protein Z949_1967 [Sulfitobacter guttiformis KCTC 32187]RKE95478.1 hypothetical protein C8N30_0013 [Sulfitobacter guttiformis]